MTRKIEIPVTIVAGFLGAGKTTLMNHILNGNHGEKIAVIMNEFGSVAIDDQLLNETKYETIHTLKNGCICCVTQNELEGVLAQLMMKLLNEELVFNRLVVELSGMAHPLQVIHTFFNDQLIRETYHIDCVVTVVDAIHFSKHIMYEENEVQIGCADVVLVNKANEVEPNTMESVFQQLRERNAFCEMKTVSFCDIPLSTIFNRFTFDVHPTMDFVYESVPHLHHAKVESIVLEETRPLDIMKVHHFINDELHMLGDNLLRYKGILSIFGKNKRMVLQGLYHLFSSEVGTEWEKEEERKSQLVLIGKSLSKEKLQHQLSLCVSTNKEV